MSFRQSDQRKIAIFFLLFAVLSLLSACSSTQHLHEGQYLLRKNTVILKSEGKIANRVEVRDNLNKMVIQKPNTNSFDILPFRIPLKLWRYNHRYRKLHNRPDSSLPKSVERPVILDTSLMLRTATIMKNDLFNRGYFYASVKDTYVVKHKKAYVTYRINTGINYRINNIRYYIDDSTINRIVCDAAEQTVLTRGKEFAYSLTAEERSRLTMIIRNYGYYKFTLDNIAFVVDTVDKSIFRNLDDPFKNAISYKPPGSKSSKPNLDLEVHIVMNDDTNAFTRFKVNKVTVYPDYLSANDLRDSSLKTVNVRQINFKYHKKFVHSKVLYEHIFVAPGGYYNQLNHDKTQTKLTELGIFQYTRLVPREERRNAGVLDYDILLARSKKYDFSTLYELSSGSTYALGHSLGLNFRDKNFMKGANLLTIGINGGLEFSYDNELRTFDRQTTYYGVNASIDFPKFLAPIASSLFDNSNLPHTIIGGGNNVIDRMKYFTLVNTSATFSYSWRESQTKTWSFSPAFVNIISLTETDSFKKVLEKNSYLRNSYKENFIEGENITYTFDNLVKKHAVNYSYVKLGIEEAGALLGELNRLGGALNDLYKIQYAQYAKFDFDMRHYFTLPRTVVALRFYGGVGVPYGHSPTLPYIKQYFSGGPYSLRGWRIRTLGPGTYVDTTTGSSIQVDRTGDIKLEMNGEFRFPVTMLFGGYVKMNGALFADAGNIWLAHKDVAYPGGEFDLNTFGKGIAADAGLGTRFDIASFLTLRIDLAMPLKKPYLSGGGGWVLDQINFNNSSWRADNLVLNVSIGYPF